MQLEWDPTVFGGTEMIEISATEVWKPSLGLKNRYHCPRQFQFHFLHELYHGIVNLCYRTLTLCQYF